MSDIAIRFENVSKQYRLGLVSTRTLSHDLRRWWVVNILGKEDPYIKIGEINDRSKKGESEYVWALKDINFEIKKGEVIGIIGKNGAGKTTLLKILSRVTSPTTGCIKADGRIASLLEVGTGFHKELTGRENIFMNGLIMGMTNAEIRKKFDAIVDFAGVERYIDTPVKRYSSGMLVRLGFAVAAHLEAEILVVDEVLAVGDAEFQKKAIGKMQDVSRNQGRTVLFVSHNMGSISLLCNKGIILSNGFLSLEGKIEDCINRYISEFNQESYIIGENTKNDIFLKKVSILNSADIPVSNLAFHDTVHIRFEIEINELPENATLSFTLLDAKHYPLFSSHYRLKNNSKIICAQLPKEFLLPGTYNVMPILHVPNVRFIDQTKDFLSFKIEDSGNEHSIYDNPDIGILNVQTNWTEE